MRLGDLPGRGISKAQALGSMVEEVEMSGPQQDARVTTLKAWHALNGANYRTDTLREAQSLIRQALHALGVLRETDAPMPQPCRAREGGICYLRQCHDKPCNS